MIFCYFWRCVIRRSDPLSFQIKAKIQNWLRPFNCEHRFVDSHGSKIQRGGGLPDGFLKHIGGGFMVLLKIWWGHTLSVFYCIFTNIIFEKFSILYFLLPSQLYPVCIHDNEARLKSDFHWLPEKIWHLKTITASFIIGI